MRIMRGAMLLPMLLAVVLGADGTLAVAKPTPLPGGANQAAGVSGTMHQVLWNKKLRVQNMSLVDAVEADKMRPSASQRALVLHLTVKNGLQHSDHGYFNATLADADGITIEGRPLDDGWDLAQQGSAARASYGFLLPPNFVPKKLVLQKAADPKSLAFRITIRPGDVPAAPAPVATP